MPNTHLGNKKYTSIHSSQNFVEKKIHIIFEQPIAVAARSEARTVFARPNNEIVCSNPTGGMDVCMCSVCVISVSA
jgi:hypothetical protein